MDQSTETNRGFGEALGRSVYSNGKARISSQPGYESTGDEDDKMHKRYCCSSTIVVDAPYAEISYEEAGKGTDKRNARTLCIDYSTPGWAAQIYTH